jgi:hypothetical protein
MPSTLVAWESANRFPFNVFNQEKTALQKENVLY